MVFKATYWLAFDVVESGPPPEPDGHLPVNSCTSLALNPWMTKSWKLALPMP